MSTPVFQRGAAVYPLALSTTRPLLLDADPAVFYALDYFTAVLNAHLGPRLVAESFVVNAAIDNAVVTSLPYDVAPYLTEAQYQFPILSIARASATYGYASVNWAHQKSVWNVAYVLPPLSAAQAERLLPALHAASSILDDRTEKGSDASYANGAAVWSLAGVEAIELVSSTYGTFTQTKGLDFPAWVGTFNVTERTMEAAGANPFLAGVDLAADVANSNPAGPLPGVVQSTINF